MGRLWRTLVAEGGLFVLRRQTATADYFSYLHHSFEEYFAARQLVQDPAMWLTNLRRYRLDPRWDEVFLLALGFISKDYQEAASRLLYDLCLDPLREEQPEYEELFHRDLLIALRACADGILPLQSKMRQIIQELVTAYVGRLDEWQGEYFQLHQHIKKAVVELGKVEQGQWLLEALIGFLEHPSAYVRHEVAEILFEVDHQNRRAVSTLLKLLHEQDAWVRLQAVGSLINIEQYQQEVADAFLRTLLDEPRALLVFNSVVDYDVFGTQHSKEMLDITLSLLNHRDAEVRYEAARLLLSKRFHEQQAINTMFMLCIEADKNISENASAWLAVFGAGHQQTTDGLGDLLHNENAEVSYLAANTLLSMNDRMTNQYDDEAIEALIVTASSSSDSVRFLAARDLLYCKSYQHIATHTLLALLNSIHAPLRQEAAEVLLSHDSHVQEALSTLLDLLNCQDDNIRYWAAVILLREGRHQQEATNTLLLLLNANDIKVKVDVARYLSLKDIYLYDIEVVLESLLIKSPALASNMTAEVKNDAYDVLYHISMARLHTNDDDALCLPISPASP